MSSTNRLHSRAEWWVVLIGVLACAITFSGRLHSADEIAVYTLTHSLGQRGALDINILASTAPGMTAPPFSGVGQFGPDANFYSGKGVLPSLLALPLFALSVRVGADPVVAVLALSAILTVVTAFVIARFVRRELGLARAAFWSGALYLAGTMALAYSKRLFTEPAAALCVALAFVWLASEKQRGIHIWPVAAGLAFGGAIAGSYSNLALLPSFVALIAVCSRRMFGRHLTRFLAGVAPWLAGLAIYNLVRFGNPLETGLSLLEWSLPYYTPQAGLIRIYGLLFSPYRSLVLYNPILLLLPLAWLARRAGDREEPGEGLAQHARLALFTAISGTAAYLLFFSLWSMWWGGFNWGPRFLLPIMPVWLIALAPAFEIMPDRTPIAPARSTRRIARGVIRLAMWLVVALAIVVSAIGGLADTFRSEGELARQGELSALVKPESLAASPLLTDIAAFQAVTGAGQIGRGEIDTWWATPSARDEDLARALADVAERATPDSAVLLVAPARIEPFLHAYRLPNAVVGLSPDQITSGDDAPAWRLLSDATRILLVTDAAQADPGNTTERWLEDHAFRARNEFYGGWRVAVFGAPVTPTAVITPTARFGDALVLSTVRYSPIASPGGGVTIEATWTRTDTTATADTTDTNNAGATSHAVAWFAHLIAPDGVLVGQHDALIGSGYPWDATSSLIDHRGILVAPDTTPGAYQVRIGAYASDGARLPVVQAEQRLPGDVIVFDVVVQ